MLLAALREDRRPRRDLFRRCCHRLDGEALADAGRGADLFICECSSAERFHSPAISLIPDLAPRLAAIAAKRIILTHLNPDMLARRVTLAHETAEDGLTVTV